MERNPRESLRIALAFLISALAFLMINIYKNPWFAAARAVTLDLTLPEEAESGFSLEVISVSASSKHSGRVYIYHTHTYEAYEMDSENQYKPTETWRTADPNYNMIRVGEELKKYLQDAGITVFHDTTAYEPPKLSTAYARSLEGLKKAAQEGYDLYIDLHRDSYSKGNGPNIVEKSKQQAARLLILIGQGTGTGFDERPEWEKNQKAAQLISDALNAQLPSLCRGVVLKSGRYNQQAATPSMLIEVGNNKNTMPEALNAMPYLANAICAYFDLRE